MKQLDDNLWLIGFPLKLFGVDARRNVCVIRLGSGELVIHSTGPFTPGDVEQISRLGRPAWVLDGMLDHDTFAKAGRDAFPSIPFLAPTGFESSVDFPIETLLPAPSRWGEELQVLKVSGVPSFSEHVFLHRPSKTLIVCDLLFNFPPPQGLWSSLLLTAALGGHRTPGMSRRFKAAIRDRDALKKSIQELLAWDFERIVVGHGEPILSDGKQRATETFRREGLFA